MHVWNSIYRVKLMHLPRRINYFANSQLSTHQTFLYIQNCFLTIIATVENDLGVANLESSLKIIFCKQFIWTFYICLYFAKNFKFPGYLWHNVLYRFPGFLLIFIVHRRYILKYWVHISHDQLYLVFGRLCPSIFSHLRKLYVSSASWFIFLNRCTIHWKES